jgi:hypothetical protein
VLLLPLLLVPFLVSFNSSCSPASETVRLVENDLTASQDLFTPTLPDDALESPNAVFVECKTCLKRNDSQLGLGGSDVLQNLPAEGASGFQNLLLHFPFIEFWTYGLYRNSSDLGYVLAYRTVPYQSNIPNLLDDFGRNAIQLSRPSGNAPHTKNVSIHTELYAAHVSSRAPLLAILGAETQLPKITREEGASPTPSRHSIPPLGI